MIVDCVSDLHGHYPKLEGGDLLIIAGDLTARDTECQHDDFFVWLNEQDYKKKIFIGGNHDNYLSMHNEKFLQTLTKGDLIYLCDSGTEFIYEYSDIELEQCGMHPSTEKTFKIWGSPWTKRFPGMNPHCMAFTVDTDKELAEKWALIPDDVDILVTHCPPYAYLDTCVNDDKMLSVGSPSLLKRCYGYDGVFPKIHVFGHIHEQGGKMVEVGGGLWRDQKKSILINASHVNERYKPVNKPIRVNLGV